MQSAFSAWPHGSRAAGTRLRRADTHPRVLFLSSRWLLPWSCLAGYENPCVSVTTPPLSMPGDGQISRSKPCAYVAKKKSLIRNCQCSPWLLACCTRVVSGLEMDCTSYGNATPTPTRRLFTFCPLLSLARVLQTGLRERLVHRVPTCCSNLRKQQVFSLFSLFSQHSSCAIC